MSAAPPEPAAVAPLDELLAELGPIPGPLAADYGRQAALLLRIFHDAGQCHGDIRPGTLLVGPVAVRPGPDGSSRRRPNAGALIALAAPKPGAESAAPADDVYALGAALYHLLAGRPPGPAAAPLEGVRPDLPPEFGAVVGRMTDPDPAARPTAGEAADALAGVAQAVVATPVAGPAPWWAADPFPSSHATARAPRGPRTAGERARIWVLVGLGLLLNLAALGFAAAWWSGALDPKPAVSTEQTPATAAPTPAGKRAERGTYRYVRYVAPAESWGNIAEFEVYGGPAGGRLKGTVIGTTGSWEDSGNTREKAFDGDLESFFDAPDTIAEGAWVGLDLGSAQVLTRVRFAPRPGYGGRMVGGVFQASNAADFSSGVVDLFAVTDAPPEGAFSARAVGTPPPRGRKARPDPDTDLDGVRD